MTDKANKALKTANIRISVLVWKLHKQIESAKRNDNSFTEVEAIRKLAIDSFKLFLEYGVLDENAHLHKPKHKSPRPHSASPDRRQNVRTSPGSEGSAGKRSKSATRTGIKEVRPTPFCDDVKITLNFEDDQTHHCFERSPRKPRDFEEKYKKAKLENIHLQQELDRVQKCIEDLECQSKCLISQVNLAEKEKSDGSRKDDMRYKQLESEVNRYKAEINDLLHRRTDDSLQSDLEYLKKTLRRTEVDLKSVKEENTALRHANENKTKMIEDIKNRAEEEIKDANNAIVYYKEEQQRYKKAKDDNNAQIVKLRTEKEDANGRLAKLRTERDDANKKIAKLTTEKDDANRRLVKLRTERDQLYSDADRLKVEKDELLNMLQKQKSRNNAGRHCEDALNKQLHEKDMECKQSKKIVENLNRKLDEIQSQQKEFLKPRDREDLKREENSNQKLVEENEELRNIVFEMEQQLSVAAEKPMEEQTPFIGNLCDINRPTALADKFSSLYTDEYTEAMEVIERSMDEAGAVHLMLEWLKSCNDWCERLSREQIDLLTKESIGFMNKYHGEKIDFVIPDKCLILVKEFQKQIADNALASIKKICHVKSVKQKQKKLLHNSYIVKYIQRCSELCWRMQITNPPMCLKFDVKNGENLDKTLYNVYSKNGSRIEYLVWPILFLHKSGPLMAKGVAQGT